MAKLGRNDPCWCGGGKKYKNCHMRADESATSNTLVTNSLIEQIHEYALRPEFRSDFDKAFESYTGRKLERPDEDDEDEMTEFDHAIDYFVHDYRLPDGNRIVERFFAEHGQDLPPDQRTRVAGWQHSRFTAFDVASVERDGQLRLRDLVIGDEYPVEKTRATASMIHGEVLIARILRVGDHYELGDTTALRMSPGLRDPVRTFLTEQWHSYVDAHPNSDYEEFLHASGPALNRFVEEEILGEKDELPMLVSPEGDATEFWTATYDVVDYGRALGGLRKAAEFTETGEEEVSGAIGFDWGEVGSSADVLQAHGPEFELTAPVGAEMGGLRSLGQIALSHKSLTLDVMSRRRLDAGKELLGARLGSAIRHRKDEQKSAEGILDEAEVDWSELEPPFALGQVQRPKDVAIPILAPPVDKLLTLGEPDDLVDAYDYGKLGIGEEQIPELIRLALERDLQWAESDTKWAPIHAWRALGQLRAQAAIEPLLDLLRDVDELHDDWVGEDLPQVYGRIGPVAIPALVAYMADRSHGEWARVAANSALGAIAKRHPEARDEVVGVLMRALEHFDEEEYLSTWLMYELVYLHAVEAAPLIERAFAARAIDEGVMGDWEDVQVELGLLSHRTTPRPISPFAKMLGLDLPVKTKQDKNRKKHKRKHKKK